VECGFKPVLATNGTLLTEDIAKELKACGIARVSISLDGADPSAHDGFRKMPGAFEGAIKGIEVLKKVGIPFQINTTITAVNMEEIPKVHELAKKLFIAFNNLLAFSNCHTTLIIPNAIIIEA